MKTDHLLVQPAASLLTVYIDKRPQRRVTAGWTVICMTPLQCELTSLGGPWQVIHCTSISVNRLLSCGYTGSWSIKWWSSNIYTYACRSHDCHLTLRTGRMPTFPLMVPVASKSPGRMLQPVAEWWASCCFMVQYKYCSEEHGSNVHEEVKKVMWQTLYL